MPKVSVVMPVYNVEAFIAQAIESVLKQSFTDFELLVIDDCSPDISIAVVQQYDDPRIRIIRHRENRGLAGARNTGIRHARGEYIALLDSDDAWHPNKLRRHVTHLNAKPTVGVSFSRSLFMTPDGASTGYYQMPRLSDIDVAHCLCRNPVGNGSAAVLRREVFEQISRYDDRYGEMEARYFDEDLRQSEDIACWLHILLTTDWQMEGLPEALTYYRLNAGGLSAQLFKQLASWETMIAKIRPLAPELLAQWENRARAYQLRYLSRQAIRLQDGAAAVTFMHRALRLDPRIAREEPGRTVTTLAAAYLLRLLPKALYQRIEMAAHKMISQQQQRRVTDDIQQTTLHTI